ncbi:hypothetical protein N1851_002115 [Merluccius polli]|uniref:Uncharacterized protein n=1 Tax=Merluccius polli TaxID=89951 RepID=A0AA47P8Z6_MERPO|nr:hypothetical protein N1851_002115 [Merluccius polli]
MPVGLWSNIRPAATPLIYSLRQSRSVGRQIKDKGGQCNHRFGDSDESAEYGGFTSLGLPSNSPVEASSHGQLHWQTPYHGAGSQQPFPNQLPAPAFNMQSVTQGTAVPPHLPPPPTSTLNLRQTEEPSSSLAFRPTWQGGRMTESIPCSGLSLGFTTFTGTHLSPLIDATVLPTMMLFRFEWDFDGSTNMMPVSVLSCCIEPDPVIHRVLICIRLYRIEISHRQAGHGRVTEVSSEYVVYHFRVCVDISTTLQPHFNDTLSSSQKVTEDFVGLL